MPQSGFPGAGRFSSAAFHFALCGHASLLTMLIGGFLAGCSTNDLSSGPPRPGTGIKEYRQLTAKATTSILGALRWLDRIDAQTNRCPPSLVTAFGSEVQQLQVDSIRVRSRAQAIQARGDAYFASWSESIASIKDPRIRERAERFHPELEQCFSNIKVASQRAGAAFKPFLSGLRQLSVELEKKDGLMEPDTSKNLIRTTREQGDQVVHELGAITNQLDAITTMLTSDKH
jgi:hypothetical protein